MNNQNTTLIYSSSTDENGVIHQTETLDEDAWKNNDTLYKQNGQYYYKISDKRYEERYEEEQRFYEWADSPLNPCEINLYELLLSLKNVNQEGFVLSEEAKKTLAEDLSEYSERDIDITHYSDNDLTYVLTTKLDFDSLEISIADDKISIFSDRIVPFANLDINAYDPVFDEIKNLHIHLPLSIHCGQAEYDQIVNNNQVLSRFISDLDLKIKASGRENILDEIQYALEQSDYEQEWINICYLMMDTEKNETDTVNIYIEKQERQSTENLIEKAEKFAQEKSRTLSTVMEYEEKEYGSPRYIYDNLQVWHCTLQQHSLHSIIDINTGEICRDEKMIDLIKPHPNSLANPTKKITVNKKADIELD